MYIYIYIYIYIYMCPMTRLLRARWASRSSPTG